VIGGALLIPLALMLSSGSLSCQFSSHSPVVTRYHAFRQNYEQARRAGIGNGKWTRAMVAFNATLLQQPVRRCS
jgi:hypothetical protein